MARIVAIVGPTAAGKTDLALRLAAVLDVEVVNADSRQVYRYMDIGTAKPTARECALAPHHLIDIVDPDEEFSLATYVSCASGALAGVHARSHLPLLVGGTGQYVWSVLEGWSIPRVPPDVPFRTAMDRLARTHGPAHLHEKLRLVDPEAADRIQQNNVRRVVRALELHRATGELPSRILWRRTRTQFDSLIIGLHMDKEELVARADARIDTMIEHGFADEVRSLLQAGYTKSLPSMSSIGYREMIEYVLGDRSLEDAIKGIQRETHRLIRRQRAWFRPGDERIRWLDYGDPDEAYASAIELIEGATR